MWVNLIYSLSNRTTHQPSLFRNTDTDDENRSTPEEQQIQSVNFFLVPIVFLQSLFWRIRQIFVPQYSTITSTSDHVEDGADPLPVCEIPQLTKIIPVYYNSQYLDDWIPSILADLAKLTPQYNFQLIDQLPEEPQKMGIYLFHLVTGRSEEFLNRKRFDDFLGKFDKTIVVYLRQGLNQSSFESVGNLKGYGGQCVTLFYFESKLTMVETVPVQNQLNLLKNFMRTSC